MIYPNISKTPINLGGRFATRHHECNKIVHYLLAHIAPIEKGQDDAFRDMVEVQVWSSRGVTHTTQIVQTPPTYWCVISMH
jgi:hypothetical protein